MKNVRLAAVFDESNIIWASKAKAKERVDDGRGLASIRIDFDYAPCIAGVSVGCDVHFIVEIVATVTY